MNLPEKRKLLKVNLLLTGMIFLVSGKWDEFNGQRVARFIPAIQQKNKTM